MMYAFYISYTLYLQVEALAVKLTQEEGELIQEKFEVKKLANFLKQVSLKSTMYILTWT